MRWIEGHARSGAWGGGQWEGTRGRVADEAQEFAPRAAGRAIQDVQLRLRGHTTWGAGTPARGVGGRHAGTRGAQVVVLLSN